MLICVPQAWHVNQIGRVAGGQQATFDDSARKIAKIKIDARGCARHTANGKVALNIGGISAHGDISQDPAAQIDLMHPNPHRVICRHPAIAFERAKIGCPR